MRENENADIRRICEDPAIRLMVYQLAHLFGVAGSQYDLVHYMHERRGLGSQLLVIDSDLIERPERYFAERSATAQYFLYYYLFSFR
jgi:hypothetical protein